MRRMLRTSADCMTPLRKQGVLSHHPHTSSRLNVEDSRVVVIGQSEFINKIRPLEFYEDSVPLNTSE